MNSYIRYLNSLCSSILCNSVSRDLHISLQTQFSANATEYLNSNICTMYHDQTNEAECCASIVITPQRLEFSLVRDIQLSYKWLIPSQCTNDHLAANCF